MAIGGRTDVGVDPPYFVFAFRLADRPAADEFPTGFWVDNPDTGKWTKRTVSGRTVLAGEPAMVDQTEHLRGWPHVYDSGTVHFRVVTDEEAWAADAIRQLP